MIDGEHLAADIDEHGVRIAFCLRRLGTEPELDQAPYGLGPCRQVGLLTRPRVDGLTF